MFFKGGDYTVHLGDKVTKDKVASIYDLQIEVTPLKDPDSCQCGLRSSLNNSAHEFKEHKNAMTIVRFILAPLWRQ